MIVASELLRTFAVLLRRRIDAEAVSIYLPEVRPGGQPALLVHSEDQPAVRELLDLATADAFEGRCRETAVDLAQTELGRTVTLAGGEPFCWLLRVPSPGILSRMMPVTEESARGSLQRSAEAVWIGLRLTSGATLPWPPENFPGESTAPWWAWFLGLGAGLGWHAQELAGLLQDPVSQLPARAGFQRELERCLEQLGQARRPLTLVLVNPDDFDLVNERFGREIGNQVIREVGERLQHSLKGSDLVGRYGGAVFGVALPDTSLEESSPRIEDLKYRLMERPYRNSSVRLGFCFGAASFDPSTAGDPEEDVLDLIRRADQALSSAKQAGSGRTVFSSLEPEDAVGHLDRLSGIFTADLTKDYRNMLLLWDTVTIVAASTGFKDLASQVVDRLFSTFKPDRVGIFSSEEGGTFALVYGRHRSAMAQDGGGETLDLTSEENDMLQEARRTGRTSQQRIADDGDGDGRRLYALPLMARSQFLGGLLLGGGADWLDLDASDLIFLRALTSHVAVAIDRARLAEQEKQRQEREKRDLRTELKELHRALQQAKLIYCSPEMETLLNTVHRVAPTDATVLITGESGTGKELVARTLHELSERRAEPLVVVDCAAIADSLIDSELFGYEKGAYTGAERRGIGRLAEADGGTILLDEIGELPLAVQSKLLRFVQEKQVTPVGSSRSRRVDVRLIAATNRNLEAEAEAGQFRKDLFYRLNVVPLIVPPLRDRPDDILYLAQHFLHRSSIQYQKGVLRFTGEAERLLLRHRWPGNVRELENRIRQAVILTETETVDVADLNLGAEGGSGPQAASDTPPSRPREIRPPTAESLALARLRRLLGQQVERVLGEPDPEAFPLGTWLKEDLLTQAIEMTDGVRSHTARLLGIPETTCRRRLRKIKGRADSGKPPRPPAWEVMPPALRQLLETDGDSGDDIGLRARALLLQEVTARLPGQDRRGAALMGVSTPTYKRWVELSS